MSEVIYDLGDIGVFQDVVEFIAGKRKTIYLPNPVPFRRVSIDIIDLGQPTIEYVSALGVPAEQPVFYSHTITLKNSVGEIVKVIAGSLTKVLGVGDLFDNYLALNVNRAGYDMLPFGYLISGWVYAPWLNYTTIIPVTPTYEEVLAADQAAGTGGQFIQVMASDGEILAREVFTGPSYFPHYGDITDADIPYLWNGNNYVDLFQNALITDYGCQFKKRLTFSVPEDCIAPFQNAPLYPGYEYGNTHSDSPLVAQWDADWDAGQAVMELRRKRWVKKNSDETITRLKAGILPAMWLALIPVCRSVILEPFVYVNNGEALGMFADSDDILGAVEIETYGSAEFRFEQGCFVFVQWIPLKDSEGNTIASRRSPLTNDSGGNCFVSTADY